MAVPAKLTASTSGHLAGGTTVNAGGILLGGVIPILFLGLGTVLMRSSISAGASIPTYLAAFGEWRSLNLSMPAGGTRLTPRRRRLVSLSK